MSCIHLTHNVHREFHSATPSTQRNNYPNMPHSWDNTPSGTMRALVLESPRSSLPGACFTYKTDYPRPSLPNSKYVLVRIHAVGLNHVELRARNAEPVHPVEFGIFKDEFHLNCPKIIGEEFVGEVVEAGEDSGFSVGDRVAAWAYGGGKAYDGSYAEYTICYYRRCWKLPEAAKDVDWAVLRVLLMGLWTHMEQFSWQEKRSWGA